VFDPADAAFLAVASLPGLGVRAGRGRRHRPAHVGYRPAVPPPGYCRADLRWSRCMAGNPRGLRRACTGQSPDKACVRSR